MIVRVRETTELGLILRIHMCHKFNVFTAITKNGTEPGCKILKVKNTKIGTLILYL